MTDQMAANIPDSNCKMQIQVELHQKGILRGAQNLWSILQQYCIIQIIITRTDIWAVFQQASLWNYIYKAAIAICIITFQEMDQDWKNFAWSSYKLHMDAEQEITSQEFDSPSIPGNFLDLPQHLLRVSNHAKFKFLICNFAPESLVIYWSDWVSSGLGLILKWSL